MKHAKQIDRDDNSIYIYKSRISNSFNRYINIDFFSTISKFFQKQLTPKKYYEKVLRQLKDQTFNKLESQKANKKYIPEIYLELNEVKEQLRMFTQSYLFFNKLLDDIDNTDLSHFNSVYLKAGFDRVEIDTTKYKVKIQDFLSFESLIDDLIKQLEKIKCNLPDLSRANLLKLKKNQDVYKYVSNYEMTTKRIGWLLERFIHEAKLINKYQLMILTERAGQGKTNLICDYISTVILKKNIPAIFLSGNEFIALNYESIEAVILEKVFSFRDKPTFTGFITDIESICKAKSCNFIIFIDALNENSNIEIFAEKLYSFVENIIKHKFIKLVFTCRSEYFSERFSNFIKPSFIDKSCILSDYNNSSRYFRQELPDYLSNRLINSYFRYFKIKNQVYNNVKQNLANDFLLLRIFCENYSGDGSNTTDVIHSIHKDELFFKYYENKTNEIIKRKQCAKSDIQQIFISILKYMTNKKDYSNIPFNCLGNINREILDEIIREDIIFRKDLVKEDNSAIGNIEVINFTFDEFRDYLLADYIVINQLDITSYMSKHQICKTLSHNHNNPMFNIYGTQAEGVEKFIFIKSKKPGYKEQLKSLKLLPQYDNIFINHIFDINDQYIDDDDIEKLAILFKTNKQYSEAIVSGLMYRIRPNNNPKLNITLLFKFIASLEENEYREVIGSIFDYKRESYTHHSSNEKTSALTDSIGNLLVETSFKRHPEYHLPLEFIFLLTGVYDEASYGTPYAIKEVIYTYISKYPEESTSMFTKYLSIPNTLIEYNLYVFLLQSIQNGYDVFINSLFVTSVLKRYETIDSEYRPLKYKLKELINSSINIKPSLFTEKQSAKFVENHKMTPIFKIILPDNEEGLMIYFLGNEHLVVIPKKLTFEKFLINAKVKKDTYFGNVLANIFNTLTFSTTELKTEYAKYYSEYENFEKFIYYKYPQLVDSERKEIFQLLETEKYILLKGEKREIIDYNLLNIFNLDYENDFLNKVKYLLKAELYED